MEHVGVTAFCLLLILLAVCLSHVGAKRLEEALGIVAAGSGGGRGRRGASGVRSPGGAPPFTDWMAAHEVPGTRIVAQGTGQAWSFGVQRCCCWEGRSGGLP